VAGDIEGRIASLRRESGRWREHFSYQESHEEMQAMSVRRLNHAVLYVSDVSHSVEFYHDTLGFETATQIPGQAAFLRAPGTSNDHDLGLFQIGDTAQPFRMKDVPGSGAGERPRAGLYHLAWEVGTLSELADAARRLSARGALVGASDHRVSKSLYAKDPDGIEFEVMWRVPPEDWDAERHKGAMIAPLDLDAELDRWGDLVTGAAAGSAT
jgi:catechol-2,3-dioxygenase